MKTGGKLTKLQKTIGRQEGSKVWVINESVQINNKGDIVPEEDKEFVWIDDLFDDNKRLRSSSFHSHHKS